MGLTLWTEGHADSIGKDIDTLKDASTAVIAELDILVYTASKAGLCLSGGAAEGTGGRVHGYFNNNSDELEKRNGNSKDEDGTKRKLFARNLAIKMFESGKNLEQPSQCRSRATP